MQPKKNIISLFNLFLMCLEFYQKFDLVVELSKVGGSEAKDRKGMRLLYELGKIASISCPGKVTRLELINIY